MIDKSLSKIERPPFLDKNIKIYFSKYMLYKNITLY